MTHRLHLETLAIHAGQAPDPATGAVMTPIYQTSTYVQSGVGEHKGYDYARTGNPTRTALEACLAELEGVQHGLCFASGMAAIDTLLRLVRPGQHVLAGNDVYGGTYRLFVRVLSEYGLHFDFVDMSDLDQVHAALKPNTRLVPSSPSITLLPRRTYNNRSAWAPISWFTAPPNISADTAMSSAARSSR